MHEKVKEKFQALVHQKEYLLQLIDGIGEQQLNLLPSDGSWSLAQVYFHLYLVEKLTLNNLQESIKVINNRKNTKLINAAKSFLLYFALILPKKYRAPGAVRKPIPKKIDCEKLITDWNELRDNFQLLLTNIQPHQFKKAIFKHPYSGEMNIMQTLNFIKHHHQHHVKQINRLKQLDL